MRKPTTAAASATSRVTSRSGVSQTSLRDGWTRHQTASGTRADRVSTLANAWMRNRQEELLFGIETQQRAPGQARMWTNLWIQPPAPDEGRPTELNAERGVRLGTAPGGSNASDGALVDLAAIAFITALNGRFPAARFGTYMGHGAGGFQRRGLSVDVTMDRDQQTGRSFAGRNPRGFRERENVLALLPAIDATAGRLGYRFFAIYNDFAVARHVNRRVTNGNVRLAISVAHSSSVR